MRKVLHIQAKDLTMQYNNQVETMYFAVRKNRFVITTALNVCILLHKGSFFAIFIAVSNIKTVRLCNLQNISYNANDLRLVFLLFS